MAVPMLTYASENWTINRADKRKTEPDEMRFLGPVAGYSAIINLLDIIHRPVFLLKTTFRRLDSVSILR
jgi:hypothetical protein